MTFRIRPVARIDVAALQEIERRAGERFREIGFDDVADDEPLSLDTLIAYADDGRAWLAVDDRGNPLGYVLVDVVDGAAHIEQVSVVPECQGQGIGRALIERVERWAFEGGRTGLTLTTFSDVPWNRPLYEHLGFRVLDDGEIGPELRRLRQHEAAAGFDPATRVAMRRDVSR